MRPIKFATNLLQGSKIWWPSSTATRIQHDASALGVYKQSFTVHSSPVSPKATIEQLTVGIFSRTPSSTFRKERFNQITLGVGQLVAMNTH